MNTQDRAKAIFLGALEIASDEQRRAIVDARCGEESGLRAEVEELLRHHQQVGSFLESPAHGVYATAEPPLTEAAGTVIGSYKLLEQIGEGGFGVVFMAEQERPVQRKVALKIIKPGMDTKEVIARFEAERQALALMDHPNIAKVLDAGTTAPPLEKLEKGGLRGSSSGQRSNAADPAPCPPLGKLGKGGIAYGRPYFVMELVRGIPITEYCDHCNLTARERLGLFITICQAVQHAHQKGIIHRDLKPSNVLIAMQDGMPTPKIIDFGVAKAINQRLTEHTLQTGFAQMLGTPLYMSPEQAEMSPLELDTRSDIYSLGVLLYELLTGTTPFEKERLSTASFDELRRIIREEEPPRPSTRLSTMQAADLSTVAERHRIEPRRLTQQVRGDLDWIVMKCLEKDRRRRYETANCLASDVERSLNEQPIEACPPSRLYRLRKFVRRNKGPVLAAVALGMTLVAGIVGTTIGLIRATIAEAEARAEADRAQLAELRERERSDQAEAETEKAQAVVEMLREMLLPSESWGMREPDYTLRQLIDDFSVRLDGRLTRQPELEAEIRTMVAGVYFGLGLPGKAESHLRTALDLRRSVLGERHPKVVESLIECAWNANARMDFAQAEAHTRAALDIARDLGDPQAVVRVLSSMQNFLNQQRKYQEADAVGAEALELARSGGPVPEAVVSDILLRLAGSRLGVGRLAEAEQLAREALALSIQVRGPNYPFHVGFYEVLISALQAQGNYGEAEAACRAALALLRRDSGYGHVHVAGMLNRLGLLLDAQGDYAAAEAVYLEALPIAAELLAEDPDEPAHRHRLHAIRWDLGAIYVKQGLREKAVEIWTRAIQEDPANAERWFSRAEFHRRLLREWDPAIADYSKTLELDPSRADARARLATCLVARPKPERRDPARAIQLAREALERDPNEGYYWNTLGQAHYRAARWQEAIGALRESLTRRPDDDGIDYFFLAMSCWQLGEHDQARGYYRRGVRWMEEYRPKNPRTEEFGRFQAETEELLGIGQ